MAITIEEMAVFCKKKGFVYQNSELYGGMSGFYDYGPLGVELKNNIKQSWWKRIVQERSDVVGMDATIISHPKVWEASGHVGCFFDVMLECKKCHARHRGDHLIHDILNVQAEGLKKDDINKIIKQNNIKCPLCKGELAEANEFNLMFKTHVGPVEAKENAAYLRPETAQAIFVNFKLITETSRVELPFGIAQSGKAFRNEISPRDFLFRTREFEQMELEYFIHPEEEKCALLKDRDYEFQILTAEAQEKKKQHIKMTIKQMLDKTLLDEWHAYWLKEIYQWFIDIGIKEENLRLRQHLKNELAHYSGACFDIEYNFPSGWKEIHGNANRSQFDLKQHEKFSSKKLEIYDEKTKSKVIPRVIEPSQGVDRAFLAILFDAYNDDKERGNIVLKLHPALAPVKVGVFPLINKLDEEARKLYNELKCLFTCQFDRSGSIGRRYARADENGIPYCVTFDFDSLNDKKVTIRERDTTKQARVKVSELRNTLRSLICGELKFSDLG